MDESWYGVNQSDHFWMEWRFVVFQKYAKSIIKPEQKIFEIGCGNGVFRKQVEDKYNFVVDACDLNLKGLEMAGDAKGRLMMYDVYDRDPTLINQYDHILLMDVLEHIDDDVAFLKVGAEHLKSGGHALINVPANMFLFSNYDRAQGHERRYSKASLKHTINKAGLELISIGYWGLSLVPLLMMRKLVLSGTIEGATHQGFKAPGKAMHDFLKLIKQIETGMFKTTFTGTSIMAVAKKPD